MKTKFYYGTNRNKVLCRRWSKKCFYLFFWYARKNASKIGCNIWTK